MQSLRSTSATAILALLRPRFLTNSREPDRTSVIYPERFGVIGNSQSSSLTYIAESECDLSSAMQVDAGKSHVPSCVPVSNIEQFYSVGVSGEAIMSGSLSQNHSPVSSGTVNACTRKSGTITKTPRLDPLGSPRIQSGFSNPAKCTVKGSIHLLSPTQLSPFETVIAHSSRRNCEIEFVGELRRTLSESGITSSANIGKGQVKVLEQDHEFHIWTERERRKKMRGMFVTLQSMLPEASPKADKSTIVDDAICYIKLLEQKLQMLLTTKAGRSNEMHDSRAVLSSPHLKTDHCSDKDMLNGRFSSLIASEASAFQTWCLPNVVLNICGADAFINICTTSREGILSKIFSCVVEPHNLEVVNVQISSGINNKRLFMIHTRATDESTNSGCKSLKMSIEDLMVFLDHDSLPAS